MTLDQSALGLWQPAPGRTRCKPSPLKPAFVLAPTNALPAAGTSIRGPMRQGGNQGVRNGGANGPRASRAGQSDARSSTAARLSPSVKRTAIGKSPVRGKGLKHASVR